MMMMMTYYFHNEDVKVLLVRMLTNINMVAMAVLDLRDGCVMYNSKERCCHLKTFPKVITFVLFLRASQTVMIMRIDFTSDVCDC